MIILYFGGQKSGKSRLAEEKILELSNSSKPFYIATYNNSYDDKDMDKKVLIHQQRRKSNFITIEENKNLEKVIKKNSNYLIDCLSMWLFNNLDKTEDILLKELEKICKIDTNIVFVLNDVNQGLIPIGNENRRFVDLTGVIGQKIASLSDVVYEVKFGLCIKIK